MFGSNKSKLCIFCKSINTTYNAVVNQRLCNTCHDKVDKICIAYEQELSTLTPVERFKVHLKCELRTDNERLKDENERLKAELAIERESHGKSLVSWREALDKLKQLKTNEAL